MQTPPTPKPQLFCISCRSEVDAVWMNFPAYLKATNREAHWAALPCSVCERKEEQRREEAERIRLNQRRVNTLVANSMVKKRFLSKTFDNFVTYGNAEAKQIQALTIAKDFAENFEMHREQGTWLLMMGSPGTGKTHLCAAIINHIVRKGYTALFTKTYRLLRQIKDTYTHNPDTTEQELLSTLEKLDLLVIDELGVQFGTHTERNILFEILDSRYEDMMPTILTTNIPDLDMLAEMTGDRIIDRLFEGESKVVVFDWESYRRFQCSPKTTRATRRKGRPILRPV